jgi:hypothetical protein
MRAFHRLDPSIESLAVTAPVAFESETGLFTSAIRIMPLELSDLSADGRDVWYAP